MKKLLLFLGAAMSAVAQVEVTAETMGRGKSALFVSGNILAVKDYTVLTASAIQYWYGLTSRMDVFGGASVTTAFGQAQTGVTAGANINLVKAKLFSLSTLNTLSIPANRRSEGVPVWFTAVIASHDFGKLSVYGGYSATIPVGHSVVGKLFTPSSVVYNLPIGVAIPKGKKLLVFVEYDYGRQLQATGLGFAYTF